MELIFRTLTPGEIDCRVSQINEDGLFLLLYKDARCDMNLLDETVGPMNWTRKHSRDNANCEVSIYDADRGIWVSKEDTGTESNTEAAKGLASDSFKRACVNWGIGRELYTAPPIRIKAGNYKTKQARNGRLACATSFSVKDIEYNEEREIVSIAIVRNDTDEIVYAKGTKWEAKREVEKANPKPTSPSLPSCVLCGTVIEDYTTDEGKIYTAAELVARSKTKYGKCVCIRCAEKLNGG